MDKDTTDLIFERLEIIEARMNGEDDPTSNLANWMPEMFHTSGVIGGIVVDEGKARESTCRRISLGDDSYLMYSKGVVGALSREQEKLYCTDILEVEVSPEVKARTKALRDATYICQAKIQDLVGPERAEVFMPCLVREARAKGVEV